MRSFNAALPPDAVRQIRNFNRRLRYRQTLDRPKVWPGDPVHSGALFYRQPDPVIAAWCATLVEPPSTAAYVSSWCRLNHLLEA
ncbi:hypothetical protein [Dechloromonas sp. H13]|uniref:hypothetical protein n=1 Tax=Dechloromonas sp. H13 TaxID=2570193 RepID=UPI0012916984|nr:hypothetical protein [Dechloromonas sp. H13]